MAYETVFIIRQDVSSVEVDKISEEFANIAKSNGAEIVKTEYWGLRALAYEIGNNKKGHYVMFGWNANNAAVRELERKMKLSENVIRFLTVRVDEVSKDQSPLLNGKSFDAENTIDVTN